MEAELHLRRIFGEGVETLLDVTLDPSGIDRPFPYARIRTGEGRRAVSKKLRRFDEEWWLDASARADGRLEFAIAAQPVQDEVVAL